jgi:predicted DNA-binding protein (MmcQ/YjbR family)
VKYEWIDGYLLSKKGVEKDFKEEWGCFRYRIFDKMFAYVGGDKYGKPIITMKIEPLYGDFLKKQYKDIVPGYYANKTHWVSLYLEGNVDDETVRQMLDNSYKTLIASLPKKYQRELE